MTSIRPTKSFTPVPDSRLRDILAAHKVTEGVAVVGIRGYVDHFPDPAARGNIIGKYDDVICIVTPTQCRTFLGNTDPSRTLPQRAVLECGRYRYMRGIHGITRPKEKRYWAWVQAGPVDIRRIGNDGKTPGPPIKGQWIGCNIHKGSWTTTGSAGCQTIIPEKWKEFDDMLLSALKAAAQDKFWYVLTV